MENKKSGKDELNYKQAYYYLFNKMTDIIKSLEIIQKNAENICVDESASGNFEIDAEND